MSGLREHRLGNQFQQNNAGIQTDVVAGSASADGIIPKTLAFSDLYGAASYSIAASGRGYQVNEGGVAVEVNPASDPNTVIHISVDDGANFIKMVPGSRLELPYRFDRVFVKRAVSLPNDSSSFELDFFRTKQARLISEPAAPKASQSGAALFAVRTTEVVPGLAQNVAPQRSNRTRVLLQNLGPDDVWVGNTAATDATNGELLVNGDERAWIVSADVFAVSNGASSIRAREEYNP